jgi:hypothetical protein
MRSFSVQRAKKMQSTLVGCYFLVTMKRTLRCMKNEVAFGYEVLLSNIKNEKMCALLPGGKAAASYWRSQCFVFH